MMLRSVGIGGGGLSLQHSTNCSALPVLRVCRCIEMRITRGSAVGGEQLVASLPNSEGRAEGVTTPGFLLLI